jgi:hypothetical protein
MTESAIPLKRARPDLPDELCTLIDLGLAKRREQRLGNLESLLALLEPCTDRFSGRKVPLLTVQLAAERAPVTPYVQRTQALSVSISMAAGQSSLQPVDKPVNSPLPQPSAAGTNARGRLGARKSQLFALAALAVASVAGWVLSRGNEASSLASDPLPAPAQIADPIAAHQRILADELGGSAQPQAAASSAPNMNDPVAGASTDASSSQPQGADEIPVLTRSKAAPIPRQRGATKRSARPETTAKETTRPDCNPNYVFDAQGEKHWKPACF